MKEISGSNVLLTGASGGLGTHICEALARNGANLALVAFPGTGLQELAVAAQKQGVRAAFLAADLRIPAERERVAAWATNEVGPVDVLINNAGVEYTAEYHHLHRNQIQDVLRVNLEAPMLLSHDLLPGMLKRGRGHIVNISSLAGKSGPACQESYAATKAALVGFTFSLRATYRHKGVSASVICPGFVETGIYSRIKAAAGRPAPAILAACAPDKVSAAVLRAIRRDKPEIIVSRYPMRPILALNVLFPSFAEWFSELIGVNTFFRQACNNSRTEP